MAMTTSKYIYRYNYQPLPGGIFTAPFPYSYYYGWDEEETTEWCLKQLDLLLHSQTASGRNGGHRHRAGAGRRGLRAGPARLPAASCASICDEHDILLMVDEVQSGFGRTGKFFAFEHAGIVPDIIVMAKGLGSGMPISAIAASAALMEQLETGHPRRHLRRRQRRGRWPRRATTIDVIRDEKLVHNAAARGATAHAAAARACRPSSTRSWATCAAWA